METIQISKATPELDRQLRSLINLEFSKNVKKWKVGFIYFIAITAVTIIVAFLPENSWTIPFKGVSIVFTWLMWILTLLLGLYVCYIYYSRIRWKKKAIKEVFLANETYDFGFDAEQIYFRTKDFESTVKWNYYSYYIEKDESIFMFKPKSYYDSLYYSKTELGVERYSHLKEIVIDKLQPLP